MYWVSYENAKGRSRVGVVKDGSIFSLGEEAQLLDILRGPETLSTWAERALSDPNEVVEERDVTYASLIQAPPSVRDFMAFEEHVVTSHSALGLTVDPGWYQIPVFYFSNPAAMKAPRETIRMAPGSKCFDFELEFAAVIGRTGSDIAVEDAESHIAGYTIMCDWSARDHQELEMRQNLGPAKGKDTATSLGPYLVTPDEIEHRRLRSGFDLEITAHVNGKRYSTGNLADIYWSFAQMISFASRGTELRPGDVIGSGTVGTGCILELSRVHGAEAYPYLEAGDHVVIDGGILGSIDATMEASPEPSSLGEGRRS
ncbi:fumarylacetoacetate hydrolase family protein [Streptomyces sp. NPDC046821]|uniref:fumarylacetoacetate hydrolase family protein n=1 Tax=Streptomyces sp. NPDC046821 TaxID=3154702 RepID=UPI0033D5D02A